MFLVRKNKFINLKLTPGYTPKDKCVLLAFDDRKFGKYFGCNCPCKDLNGLLVVDLRVSQWS